MDIVYYLLIPTLALNLYSAQATVIIPLVSLIMTGIIVAGKNNSGFKYGGIAKKPPNLTRHYFTCNIIFTKKFVNPPKFTCHIAKLAIHNWKFTYK